MNIKKINALREVIASHAGQFFSVTFVKKDGTVRELTGQFGHRKGHDGKNTVQHKPELMTVTENRIDPRTGERAFRNINLESVTYLAIGGMKLYAA